MVRASEEWHWAEPGGPARSTSAAELTASLTNGTLRAETWVWKPGWAEWLPASRVAELRAAVGDRAEPVALPKRDERVQAPPPVPPGPPQAPAPSAPAATASGTAASGPILAGTRAPASPGAHRGPPPKPSRTPSPEQARLLAVAEAATNVPGGADKRAAEPVVSTRPPPPSRALVPGAPLARQAPLIHEVKGRELPAALGRRPMPTLQDEELPKAAGNTLRPPAAMPPPPRAMPPAPAAPPLENEPTAILFAGAERTSMDRASLDRAAPDRAAPDRFGGSERPHRGSERPLGAVAVPPTVPPAAPEAAPAPAETRVLTEPLGTLAGSSPAGSVGAIPVTGSPDHPRVEVPRETESSARSALIDMRSVPAPAPSRAKWVPVVVAAIAGSAVTAVLFFALTGRREAPKPTASAQGSAAPASVPLRQCLLAKSARKLAPSLERSVTPELVQLTGERLAIGYAEDATTAVGISVAADLGAVKSEFREPGSAALFGVIPVPSSGALEFRADRRAERVTSPRSLDVNTQLGATRDGFVRVNAGTAQVLWPDGGGDITPPRVAPLSAGHALAFRQGGQSGKLRLGFLDARGQARGKLLSLEHEGQVGSPSLATHGEAWLIAFASRPDADAKWGVVLVAGRYGQPPGSTRSFVIPPGGPGVETISPSAAGLANGRWLLQWTEGASGNRQVRVQTLTPELDPIGGAITLSAVEDNAGQGTVQAVGNGAVSVFIVIRNETRQLWGAALTCP